MNAVREKPQQTQDTAQEKQTIWKRLWSIIWEKMEFRRIGKAVVSIFRAAIRLVSFLFQGLDGGIEALRRLIFENGIWTYDIHQVWEGLKAALSGIEHREQVGIVGISGRPMVIRKPDSKFTLANFFRSQLYSTMATLKLGMEILEKENVAIDSLMGHGGPYGMALLAAYCANKAPGETLEDYLKHRVFADTQSTVMPPNGEDIAGFERYMQQYKAMLTVEKTAVDVLN